MLGLELGPLLGDLVGLVLGNIVGDVLGLPVGLVVGENVTSHDWNAPLWYALTIALIVSTLFPPSVESYRTPSPKAQSMSSESPPGPRNASIAKFSASAVLEHESWELSTA